MRFAPPSRALRVAKTLPKAPPAAATTTRLAKADSPRRIHMIVPRASLPSDDDAGERLPRATVAVLGVLRYPGRPELGIAR